jgi:hypothetical protein
MADVEALFGMATISIGSPLVGRYRVVDCYIAVHSRNGWGYRLSSLGAATIAASQPPARPLLADDEE